MNDNEGFLFNCKKFAGDGLILLAMYFSSYIPENCTFDGGDGDGTGDSDGETHTA